MKVKKRHFGSSFKQDHSDFFFIMLLWITTLYKLPLFEQYINIRETAIILVLSIWGLFKIYSIKKKKLNISTFDLFLFLAFLFFFVHYFCFSDTGLYYTRAWIYLFSFFALFLFRQIPLSRQLQVFWLLAFLSFLQALLALGQYLGLLNVDREFFTVVGSFAGPNFLGLFLVFGLIISAYFLVHSGFQNIWKITIGPSLAVPIILVLLLTNSRGSWLALLSSLVIAVLTSKKARKKLKSLSIVQKTIIIAILGLVTGVFGKFIYGLNTESISGRFLIAKITSNQIADRPILGHGLFSFPKGYNEAKATYFMSEERDWAQIKVANYVTTAYNDYLLIGYELGIPFLLFILGIIGILLFKTEVNFTTRVALSLLTSIAVWSLFNSIFSTPIFILVAVFAFSILVKHRTGFKSLIQFSKPVSRVMVTCLLSAFGIVGIYIAGSKFYAANAVKKNLRGANHNNPYSLSKIKMLAELLDNNTTSDFNMGEIALQLGHKKEGVSLMENSFNKTLKPDIGRELAMYYLQEGNFKRAHEIYELNMGLEPFRYEPLMDLIDIHENVNHYAQVVSLAQKVVALPVKIPSEQVKEYKEVAQRKTTYYSKFIDTTSGLQGTLSKTLTFKSDVLRKKLVYKVYLPPLSMINEKLPVVYINDGRAYTKNNTAGILDSLIAHGQIEPAAAVFLEPRDGYQNYKDVRQELFLCNTDFVDFFAKEFVPQVEGDYPVGGERTKRTLMGRSFGALAAAYVAVKRPEIVKNIVMQSPALHPCPEMFRMFPNSTHTDFNIFLGYGTGNDTEKQGRKLNADLTQKGYALKLDVVANGNHDWKLWKPQLQDIFTYLYSDIE